MYNVCVLHTFTVCCGYMVDIHIEYNKHYQPLLCIILSAYIWLGKFKWKIISLVNQDR